MCQMLGLSLPVAGAVSACGETDALAREVNNVIIVGAGAAGLTAGYLLQQQGIAFQILEASSGFGGRMKRTTTFANFPIPLGAEWIHVNANILDEIVNDEALQVDIATTQYDTSVDYALYEGERVSMPDIGFNEDSKFINATWFDFFEQYIFPAVAQQVTYDAVVETIDYTTETVSVATENTTYTADRVIVTAPVKLLQNGAITFTPALPDDKQEAIDAVRVWDGCKAFIAFTEKFYPTAIAFEIIPETAGQKLYYDAAYGQDTTEHVLGLFAVGTGTKPYVDLNNDELIAYMLNELDELFDGQASPNYIKHIFQNWNTDPFANGAYVVDHENWRTVRTLGQNVNNRLYFAGTSYTDGEDWSSVHTATRSAARAVQEILRS